MSTPLRQPFEDQGVHSSPATTSTSLNESRKRKRPAQPTQEFGLMRDTGEHDRARFVGSGSGIHYIRAVYLRLAAKSLNRTNGLSSKSLVPGEDDQLQSTEATSEQTPLWKPGEIETRLQDDKPSFDDLVEWSKSYFESWHPILPFLHGPDALRIFREASEQGVSRLHPLDYAILRSILSICLSDRRQGIGVSHPLPSTFVFQTVQEAVLASQFALTQPASIQSTQAALSIQVFLISMLCLNAASRLGGVIVRMALHLGLHRCPARFAFFTAGEVRIRQRVFWCIYTLERFLCQSLGLPLDIHDDDLDVCYPGDERHGAIDNEGGGESEKLKLLTYVAKHARIRGLILELRNKTVRSRRDTAERTASVELEFAKWSNEIQDLLEDDDMDAPAVSPSHRLILSVLKHESTICLHRPLMASMPPSPSYSSAMQVCISAAKSILIKLRRHLHSHRTSDEPSSPSCRVPLTWPSFTWAVWISTFVLLHAASENQIGLDNALIQVSAGKEILRHIATRDTSWPEYCLQTVDDLTFVVQEMQQPPMDSQISITSPATVDSFSDIGQGAGRRASSLGGRAPIEGSQNISRTPHTRRTESIDGAESRYLEILPSASAFPEPSNPPASSADLLSQDIQSQGRPYARVSFSTPSQSRSGPITQRQRFRSPDHFDESEGMQYPPAVQQQSTTTAAAEPSSTYLPQAHDAFLDLMPIEGQESMRWYDQLFQSSFNAIDNPFLVAAELDGSIDPTWDYLR